MPKSFETLQERAKLAKKAKDFLKETEGRELNTEEKSRWDKIMVDVDALGVQAEDARKYEEQIKSVNTIVDPETPAVVKAIKPDPEARVTLSPEVEARMARWQPEYRKIVERRNSPAYW